MLPVSPIQKFTTQSVIMNLTPLVSSWKWQCAIPNVSTLPNFIFMKNAPTSGVFNYKIKPKNSYTIWVLAGYTGMKLKTNIIYPPNWTSTFYLSSSLYPEIDYDNTVASTWHDLGIAVSPNLEITPGLHTIIVRFEITGMKDGIEHSLSTYDFPVNIHVFDEGFYNSPLNFTFYKSANPTPSQTLVVGGSDWTLTVPNGIKLASSDVTVIPLVNGGYTASGSGNKTFQVSLDVNIGSVIGFNEITNLSAVISYATANNTIPIQVIQTGDVFPTSLVFNIYSGFIDQVFQQITINVDGDISFTHSDFLDVDLYEVEGLRKLNVFPIDPENFIEGVYNGEVLITVGTSTYVVPVTINVNSNFDIGLSNDEIPFTKTMDDLVFTSTQENTYMEIIFSTNQIENNFLYKIPFLNGKCSKNIGAVMDRLISFSEPSLETVYNIPYFNLELREKNTTTVYNSFVKSGILIMKGHKPLLDQNFAILQHNRVSRFSPKSFALVSVMSGTGIFQYKLYKNDELIFTSSQMFGYLSTIKLDFEFWQAKAGDYFKFELITPNGSIDKNFVIFPEVEHSFEIVYLDSFGLKSVLNFRGESIKKEKELTHKIDTFRYKSQFHKRKTNVYNENKISLNTGFLLESQIIEVEELMESEIAYLYKNGQKITTLIPFSEKIISKDSDKFLINYSIEFYINVDKYAQGFDI